MVERVPHPENLLGYRFIIKGKVRWRRRPSLSFLSICHAPIISSPSQLGRGVFRFLHDQARSTNYCVCVCVCVCVYMCTQAESMFQGSLTY